MTITMLELTNETCRWPLGDVGKPGFGFCGCQVQHGESYCPEHVAVAYAYTPRLTIKDAA